MDAESTIFRMVSWYRSRSVFQNILSPITVTLMARLKPQINLGSYVREDRQNTPGLQAQVHLILLFDGITPYRSVVDSIYLLDIYWSLLSQKQLHF